MRLSEADHAAVTAAVAAAEASTDGEIVTVVASSSDAYHDAALHYATVAMISVPAVFATWPVAPRWIYAHLVDPWRPDGVPASALSLITLVAMVIAFLIVRLLLADRRLRMLLTPGATKERRVRRRAVALFRVAVEGRTRAKTGVLVYLSTAERRAEIVADVAIASKVSPERWGEAMAALLEGVKAARPGDGMAAAVTKIGAVLAEHFPRSADDTNELPDRLVTL